MKIRQGFVSNSSSSSFACICKPIKFEDIKEVKDVWCDPNQYSGEGKIFFKIDEEFYNYFKTYEKLNKLNFYKVYAYCYEEKDIDCSNIPKDVTLMAFDVDQWSPSTLKEWLNNEEDYEE